MKRILATALLTFMATQVQARCADRYYYYEAKPTVLQIKKWNIYQDLSIQASNEIQDIIKLNKICPHTKNLRHNSAVYFNYIVDGDAWKKIKNPLYSNYTILFPKGIFADDSTHQITINEQHQKYRELHFQFETEYKEGPNITSVKFYIVRKGIDKMYTPQIRFAHEKVLQRDGYFFTEFKN